MFLVELLNRCHWYLWKSYEHPPSMRILRELRNEETLSPRSWVRLRGQRLCRLLTYSRQRVPYYRQLFERLGLRPEDGDLEEAFERVPLLTKDAIRANLHSLVDASSERGDLVENATGGSTGSPLRFWQGRQYHAVAVALDAYVRGWWGISPCERTASIWGADREFHELSMRERFYQWRSRMRSMNAFRMNDADLLEFCQMLRRWRPRYLTGYASALDALARFVESRGIDDLRFSAIRSAAETLWPHQRQRVERVFRSPVYNFYGSREVNNLAAECPEERRLHLISTWRYVEIVDEDGQRVPDGQLGYVTVTDLSNYGMPFIRYRNEDMARLSPDPCPCGRPSPVLEELLGRSSDLIRTRQGDLIHGEFFTHLFYGRDDIRQFQVHQISLDHLVVRYVPCGNSAGELMSEVRQKIRARMGQQTRIDVQPCEEIAAAPSGKYRFTVSDV